MRFALRPAQASVPRTSLHAFRADERVGSQPPDSVDVHGTVRFARRQPRPTVRDELTAHPLIEHARQITAGHRAADAARAAETKAEQLRVALHSSRQIGAAIGILMTGRKITEQHAFATLCTASQHLQRKLRDIAIDVIETGWLDEIPMAANHE